jgi:FtsP/CotA-like multicopper oxidase with cupredoxin domain
MPVRANTHPVLEASVSTSPLGRREFVASGLTLTGAWLLGGCTPESPLAPLPASPHVPDGPARATLTDDGDLAEPRVIRSVGGLLAASLTATTRPVAIAGRTVREPVTYGDAFPGPTLVVRPGDVVSLAFSNRIVFDQAETKPGYGRPPRHANATNLHFHGLHVPPTGTADNMAVVVPANGSWRYLFQLPRTIRRGSSGTTRTCTAR